MTGHRDPQARPHLDVVVDVGRTHCRIRVDRPDTTAATITRRGGAGLTDEHGVRTAAAVVRSAVDAAALPADAPWRLGVAVPGIPTRWDSAPQLATATALGLELSRGWHRPPAETVIIPDWLAWHLGAFLGDHGIVLAVGTGSVAVGIGHDGMTVVDGHGVLLGDDGSGAWLGREAMRAALRSLDGRGRPTGLVTVLRDRFGPPSGWPAQLNQTPAATLASVVPDLLALAGRSNGDTVARAIIERAAEALGATARAAASTIPERSAELAVVGGLSNIDGLPERIVHHANATADSSPRLVRVRPRGDAMSGVSTALTDDAGWAGPYVARSTTP